MHNFLDVVPYSSVLSIYLRLFFWCNFYNIDVNWIGQMSHNNPPPSRNPSLISHPFPIPCTGSFCHFKRIISILGQWCPLQCVHGLISKSNRSTITKATTATTTEKETKWTFKYHHTLIVIAVHCILILVANRTTTWITVTDMRE